MSVQIYVSLVRRRVETPHYTNTCVKLAIVIHLSFSERIAIAKLSSEQTERKMKNSLVAPRIREQLRRHGSSARYIRDPMTQDYRPGGACRSCGAIPRKSSRSPGPFLVVSHYTIRTTVITLQIPTVTHCPRPRSVQVDCPFAACAFA